MKNDPNGISNAELLAKLGALLNSGGHPELRSELLRLVDDPERRSYEEQLRDTDRRNDELLAMLAHELRNPLAPIANAVEILRYGPFDTQVAWCRDVIDRQVRHLARLVDDLLDVSRITRGRIELRMERVEVADILRWAVETSQPVIEAKRHRLEIRLPTEPLEVRGDPVRLAQVVSNLLDNAAKFTADGGQIRLSAERECETIAIRVRDTGRGIDPEAQPRLFELFYRVDRSIERTEAGLGIGLSLVKRLVDMHGGTVDAFSEGPGLGSELVVRLPFLPDMPACDPGNAVEHAPSRGGLRILVVDDNRDSADSLAILLGSDGNRVSTAYDGETALDLAISECPDIVLLDICLPGMDGYAVSEALRQRADLPGLRLIAMTGFGQPEDRERTKAAGFDAHLVKPVDFDALRDLMAEYRIAVH